jgi:uncharacterized protein
MSTIAADAALDPRTAARRGLTVYFTVLILGSAIVETLILRQGDSIGNHLPLVLLLMWIPALSSFVARAVRGEGIADVSFRLGGKEGVRMIGVAVAFPLIVGAIAYGAGWATGLVGYTTPPKYGGFLGYLGAAILLGPTLGLTSAAGEEIGWRGYMLTRLIEAGVPQPLLVSGIIWALWHFPLILSGQYAAGPHPGISAAIFLVDVVGIAYAIGAVRLRSGSVWPAAAMHGAWNAIIQGPFDHASTGPGATLWVGESGILVAVLSLVIGYCTMRLVSTGKSK